MHLVGPILRLNYTDTPIGEAGVCAVVLRRTHSGATGLLDRWLLVWMRGIRCRKSRTQICLVAFGVIVVPFGGHIKRERAANYCKMGKVEDPTTRHLGELSWVR
jgi:hypothetical protein